MERIVTRSIESARALLEAKKDQAMDRALSFLISAGIIAFGIWIVATTIAAGSPLAWTLTGILPVIVGLTSLYEAVRMRGGASA